MTRIAALVALLFARNVEVGVGTTFDRAERDRFNPSSFAACLGRELDAARDQVVAHRSLPCRTRVLVCVLRTGACAHAIVGDRGPRHALVDLAPASLRALGRHRFNGHELVLLVALE